MAMASVGGLWAAWAVGSLEMPLLRQDEEAARLLDDSQGERHPRLTIMDEHLRFNCQLLGDDLIGGLVKWAPCWASLQASFWVSFWASFWASFWGDMDMDDYSVNHME